MNREIDDEERGLFPPRAYHPELRQSEPSDVPSGYEEVEKETEIIEGGKFKHKIVTARGETDKPFIEGFKYTTRSGRRKDYWPSQTIYEGIGPESITEERGIEQPIKPEDRVVEHDDDDEKKKPKPRQKKKNGKKKKKLQPPLKTPSKAQLLPPHRKKTPKKPVKITVYAMPLDIENKKRYILNKFTEEKLGDILEHTQTVFEYSGKKELWDFNATPPCWQAKGPSPGRIRPVRMLYRGEITVSQMRDMKDAMYKRMKVYIRDGVCQDYTEAGLNVIGVSFNNLPNLPWGDKPNPPGGWSWYQNKGGSVWLNKEIWREQNILEYLYKLQALGLWPVC